MSRELVCITCPLGCRLSIDQGEGETLVVRGNRCPRGAAYAREELLAPKRVVTATCRAIGGGGSEAGSASGPRRIPCRSTAAFPRERVAELLQMIYRLNVDLPVRSGQVLIPDVLGSGVDIVATRSIS